MRVEIDLDSDVYDFALRYARGKGVSLGEAIGELLRRAEEAPGLSSAMLVRNRGGMLVRARGGRVVTSDMVAEFSEDDPGRTVLIVASR